MNQFLSNLLLSGADEWNQYRCNHPEVGSDLTKEDDETKEEWRHRVEAAIDIDLADASLQDLVICGYNLIRADFTNANCRSVRFDKCDLSCVDFKGAQLIGCRFQSCTLLLTAFEGCDLCGVRFIDCEGVLAVNPQTSFSGAEVLDSRLEYLCFESVSKDAIQTEFSITEMVLQGAKLIPTEAEVSIAEVRRLN